MIELHNVEMNFPLSKGIGDYLKGNFKTNSFQALKRVSLSINDGDRIAFLGVNGAGKTTLLKLIGGILYPTKGEILINSFNTISENLLARKNVGFVLNEERSFYWRLTGIENLHFFGSLDNLPTKVLNEKIQDLINLVGLNSAGDKLVAGYSSGMKQRLAIARGLLSDPSILILDEPTRTLDPAAVEDIKHLVSSRIHEKSQRTLLIATHRFDEAEYLCNKICVMDQGRMLAFEDLSTVKEQYTSLENFYKTIYNNQKTSL